MKVTLAATLVWASVLALPARSTAETVAPSQLTPQTLRPSIDTPGLGLSLQGPPDQDNRRNNDGLSVRLGDVVVEGTFSDLAKATAVATETLRYRVATVAQIYMIVQALERAYAQAGYPLVRVVVPPQKIKNGDRLLIVVVDGFIEEIDVSNVADRVRSIVRLRLSSLLGRRHIKLVEIERALLIAGAVPGLTLRSTLIRGTIDGGTRLLVEGEHKLVASSIGGDDRLAASLGTWQLRGTIAVNGALGADEQVYGTAGLSTDLDAVAAGSSPLTVYGAGIVLPVGVDGLTFNPEYAHSTTRTGQMPGVPASLGTFERFSLRLRDPLILSRSSSLNANLAVEHISQQIAAPVFDTTLSKDAYLVVRAGSDYATSLPWGANLQVGASFSQGVTGRTEAEALASGTPLSRAGASPNFSKVGGSLRFSQPIPAGFRLDVIGSGQLSMGSPLLRSEQFGLDGNDAVSAFAVGTLNADQGATLRSEVTRPFAMRFEDVNATVAPYVFSAIGRGYVFDVTAVEQPVIDAAAVGIGTRADTAGQKSISHLSFGFELARQFTDIQGMRQGWRSNVNAAVEF